MSLIIFRSRQTRIQLKFNVETVPTFCGGATLSNLYIPTDSQYKELYTKQYNQSWKEASKEQKDAFLERYFEDIQTTLRELTSYITKSQGWQVLQKSASSGLFHTESLFGEPGKTIKLSLSRAGLQKAFILIADAINGEDNKLFSVTTYSLAEADSRWKPLSPYGIKNPNSNRLVNTWCLTIPDNSVTQYIKRNITDDYQYLLEG